MICPECKAEVKHPCWVGPVATYKGIPVHACGKCKANEIFILKDSQPPKPVDDITVTIEYVDET